MQQHTYEFGLPLLVTFFHKVNVSKAPLKLTALTPRVNIASIEEGGGAIARDLGIETVAL